jgi:hypothetical protein
LKEKTYALHLPFNGTSLGQCSFALCREIYKSDNDANLFHIGQPDYSSIVDGDEGDKFIKWINENSINSDEKHSRASKCLKLWHLHGSLESYSNSPALYTFYELDSPTKREINIAKNQSVVFMPSKHYADMFCNYGVNCVEAPLGFDSTVFTNAPIKYPDDRIVFTLAGKLEKRKHHLKILSAWAKKYGSNPNVYLNCAVYNNFMKKEDQSAMIGSALGGKKYHNINFLPWMQRNSDYNKFINSGHIVIAMSGGESWGIPEFSSVALGKHCVGLLAHGYKTWMNTENTVTVLPSGKTPAYDNIFFQEGSPYNQGNIFDFNDDEFIDACEVAIENYRKSPINQSGLELQQKFTWKNTLDIIEKNLN